MVEGSSISSRSWTSFRRRWVATHEGCVPTQGSLPGLQVRGSCNYPLGLGSGEKLTWHRAEESRHHIQEAEEHGSGRPTSVALDSLLPQSIVGHLSELSQSRGRGFHFVSSSRWIISPSGGRSSTLCHSTWPFLFGFLGNRGQTQCPVLTSQRGPFAPLTTDKQTLFLGLFSTKAD